MKIEKNILVRFLALTNLARSTGQPDAHLLKIIDIIV